METIGNLDHMRDMAGGLAQIARSNGFDALGFMFAMAELEAEIAISLHMTLAFPAHTASLFLDPKSNE